MKEETPLPDSDELINDLYKKSYLTIYSQQKPKIIRDQILVFLDVPGLLKFSMISPQLHKLMNPVKSGSASLIDYNWLLEARIGLEASRAIIVIKNLTLVHTPAKFEKDYKSNLKRVLEAGIVSKQKQDSNEEEESPVKVAKVDSPTLK